jgi:transcriptional regulator NrdR family protein
MECPFCGKIKNDVIDSRLTKERTAIRRRRKCSDCAGRFTTYESTPEHFLFLLMKQHASKGLSKKRPETMLAFMSSVFKGISEGIEKLVVKVDKPAPARKTKKPREKVAAKAKPRKRAPVRKKIVVPRPKKVTATEEVLQVIKRHKRGINISKLKNKTGFADSKLRMIISRAYKQGKIKRKARGVYVSA